MTAPRLPVFFLGSISHLQRIARRVVPLALLLFGSSAGALEVAASFSSATTAPINAGGYSAAGNSVTLSLAFAPPAGTDLILVNNTGPDPITGRFSNLAQGQTVTLPFSGVSYKFAATYHGGTGNDLILRWAGKKVHTWGNNYHGQLGNNGAGARGVPVDVSGKGALAGKAVATASTGKSHSLALCTDGTLAAWGDNAYGQLGNGTTTLSRIPVAVTISGVLAGKTVIAIAAGASHSFALCSDGTLAAWGYNAYGQLGNGLTANALAPIAINSFGALAGKSVTTVAASADFSIALCSDGTLASWGTNFSGQLGIGSDSWSRHPPVAIQMNGVLAGKRVVAISAGGNSCLALCADGTLASWGSGGTGALGNGDGAGRNVPAAVDVSGVLSGKTVTGIFSGGGHHLVLCSDGTLAAWGSNSQGQLGDGSMTDRLVPVTVPYTGALAGRTVTSVTAGMDHTLALCQDGSLVAWGRGGLGVLGNGFQNYGAIPVPVATATLENGEKFTKLASGCLAYHAIAITHAPVSANANLSALVLNPGHFAPTFSAGISDYEVRVPASISSLTVTPTIANANAKVTVNGAAQASGTASPSINWRTAPNPIRIVVTAQNGATRTYSLSVVEDSSLSRLETSAGILSPAFTPNQTSYSLSVPASTTTVRLSPLPRDINAPVQVNGIAVSSGGTSGPIPLLPGVTTIPVTVTAHGGTGATTYTVSVSRLEPLDVLLSTPAMVPVVSSTYIAEGNTIHLSLGHAPATGTNFKLIDLTGSGFINGRFSNLAQGQAIVLPFNNAHYKFVANYYGGDGNDLVLQWAGTKAYGWGANGSGALGIGTTGDRSAPTAVSSAGVLSGKTLTAVATGAGHSLALCSDGTLAGWGYNADSQLGDGTTTNSALPLEMRTTGYPYSKRVIAIAAGGNFSVAAYSDGTIDAWGDNDFGQLGNGTTFSSTAPLPVTTTGVLAGKVVVALAAGNAHVLALTSDGTMVAWGGLSDSGALGNDRFGTSTLPVAVSTDGVLAGKRVISIAASSYGCGAVCSDGTVVTWGSNNGGALGNGLESITGTCIPGTVTMSGILSGKTPVAITGGFNHFLVRCSDGTLAAWGQNDNGQLGDASTGFGSYQPVAVTIPPFLSGKAVTTLSAGGAHSGALCSDGTLAMWGYNTFGQLGNGTTSDRSVPTAATLSTLGSGEKLVAVSRGSLAYHTLALAASPLSNNSALSSLTLGAGTFLSPFAPGTTAYTARVSRSVTAVTVTPTTSEPNALVHVNGIPVISGTPSLPVALSPENRTVTITVTAQTGSSTTYSVAFVDDATLSSLAVSEGALAPAFAPATLNYVCHVTAPASSVILTPVTADPTASITLNGLPVVSGNASSPIPLDHGSSSVEIAVTALDGNSSIYRINFVRPAPVEFTFLSPADIAVSSPFYVATGNTATLSLGFAPVPGAALTVVNSTGAAFISGRFANLTHGQIITLTHANATYRFVANYHGGTGNDLVLQWADGKTYAWGSNGSGQLGNGNLTGSLVPTAVSSSFAFAGKTVLSYTSGNGFSLALFSNGTVASWGRNFWGQLGNDTTSNSLFPIDVYASGALSGKTVIAVAAGNDHSLALCSDGTVCSWGKNSFGQLGINSLTNARTPVRVTSGALAGKTVTAIAAGYEYSMALCSDGTVAAWGSNFLGQLGDGTSTDSKIPVAVNTSNIPAGKTITAIAAGFYHSFLLCSDGYLAAWGQNDYGQLGTVGLASMSIPVPITYNGILWGKTVVSIAAGNTHSLARCSDGTVAAWGANFNGQLGNGTTTSSNVPVAVTTGTGVLAGRVPSTVISGGSHCLVRCTDGFLASWGLNSSGQLGNNSTALSRIPVAVSTASLAPGEQFAFAAPSGCATHSVAFAASPLSGISSLSSLALGSGTLSPAFSAGTTLYSASVSHPTDSVTVRPSVTNSRASVKVNGVPVASGSFSQSIPLAVGANEIHAVVTAQNGTTRTYRIQVTRAASPVSTLSALGMNPGTLGPAFDTGTVSYQAAVPAGTTSIAITPTATQPGATIRVNGDPVESGETGIAIPFSISPFSIAVIVTAPDGVSTTTYSILINNIAPSFAGYSVGSAYETPVTLPLVKLLAKASDADGDTLSIVAAGPSAEAGNVALLPNSVSYTPPPGFAGTDTFPLTIRDSRGATVIGTVTLHVRSAADPSGGGSGMNPPSVALRPDGKANISFQGIPGRSYQVQRSTGGLADWTTLATIAADPAGRISFIDESPPAGSAFYRISSP